jgi:hypothetical protein
MKAKVDVIALQREMVQRIKILSKDTVYLGTPMGEHSVQLLAQRLEKVDFIMQNFELLEWLFNPNTDIKRADLVNQDKVGI